MEGELEIVRLPFACTPPLDPAIVALPLIVRFWSTVTASSGAQGPRTTRPVITACALLLAVPVEVTWRLPFPPSWTLTVNVPNPVSVVEGMSVCGVGEAYVLHRI